VPLTEREWQEASTPNVADRLALDAMRAGLPEGWGDRFTAWELITAVPVVAMHYDRKRMAEALRSRVIFSEHPELQPPQWDSMPTEIRDAFLWFAGQVEATMLALADQIEEGLLGHAD
jgi:hypothetical protein